MKSSVSVKYDDLLLLQQKGSDSAFLQAKLDYSETVVIRNSHISPLLNRRRVYPTMVIPQSSGRIGISDPPIGNYSTDATFGPHGYRDVVRPDSGTKWVAADYSAVESRIVVHRSQDPIDTEAYSKGWDIHSRTLVHILWSTRERRLAYLKDLPELRSGILGAAILDQSSQGLLAILQSAKAACNKLHPAIEQWEENLRAPDDPTGWTGRGCAPSQWEQARQFAEEFRTTDPGTTHERAQARLACWAAWVACGGPPPDWGGGTDRRRTLAKNVRYTMQYSRHPAAVGRYAVELGMAPKDLISAGAAYLRSKPLLVAWKSQRWAEAWRKKEARTAFGRRRRLLGDRYQVEKEGLNHEVQGTVADLMKMTMALISQRWPEAQMAYQQHDGWKTSVPMNWNDIDEYRGIVERQVTIDGRPISFPCKIEVIDG